MVLFGAAQQEAQKSVFRAAMTTNPLSLDEGYSSTTATRQASAYLFETLFTFGDGYEIIPQLVDTYTVSADRLVYDLNLRKGIKFHNGKEMTADDVKASFDRFVNGTHLAGATFKEVKSLEVTGAYSVRFTLTSPITLLESLALPPRMIIIPKEIAEKYMGSEIRGADLIGTGPYKLIEWLPDVHVKFEKFADYVPDTRYQGSMGLGGKKVAHFDELYFLPVPEAESRIAGLETGEFDFAESIPVTSYNRVKDNTNVAVSIVKPRWSILVELNPGNPPMNNLDFRRALVYALDMNKVLQAVSSGVSTFVRLDPSLFAEEQAYFTKAGSEGLYQSQDLNKVKELLAKAGYKGEPITYLVNKDFDWMYKACISLSEQWQAAGINVKLEFYDWASQIKKAQSLQGWHINQTGWSPRLDPAVVISSFKSGLVTSYNYSNPKMDKLLDDIRIGNDFATRKSIWDQIQKLVWDDVVNIKIGDYFELEAISSKYDGFKSFYVIPRFWNVTKK
jgi:peptide/nickel transport system substrate-binding protein